MFDIKETIKKRLKAARTHKGWTFAECGAALTKLTGKNVIASRYGNWELGINIPPLEMLFALGQVLDKPPAYLAGLTNDDGKAPETREYAVPTISTVTSGNGLVKLGDNALAFRMRFLESIKLDKNNMLAVVAPDDAMAGIIEEGDRAVIDLSETTVTRNDVFAIMVNGRLWLRWIRQTLDGNYLIQAERSDRYPDQPLTLEELQALQILGRVRMITHLR
ncbi:XRE family transcriptional regulator [Pseudomonas sp. NPDC098740]|uniref:XRE family transcriptional regulator n=1 Tax=Pseudomonas sp. NPDC098740 TaxID=3364486 RepID=UPI00383A03C9